MSNQYSEYQKSRIIMIEDQADAMLCDLWDKAWDDSQDQRQELQQNPRPRIQDTVAVATSIALNAFEDALRAEWGIIPRKPEGED